MQYWPRLLFLILIPLSIYLSFRSNPYPDKLIWSDMEGYYVYLPATFIYGGFDKVQVRDKDYLKPLPGTNKIYTKYTCGAAMLEAPFFLGAHALSGPLSYPSDGHSAIYSYGLMMAGVFYMLAGLLLLWPVLRRHFSQAATTLALGGLVFGTNLYYYTFCQPAMSHIYGFFLFAALLWLTERVLANTDSKFYWMLLGLAAGWLMLVRPTNGVILLYPLYRWWQETPDKKDFLSKHLTGLALAAGAAFCIFIPQFMYWKSMTGSWITWSYTNESFLYWKAPKVFKVLFGAWNGWILYSPIVVFPLVGIFVGLRRDCLGERGMLAVMVIATYLFASWWAWWFGGAFGHRCYVEYYTMLALPFAAVSDKILRTKAGRFALPAVVALCIYINLAFTYQYLVSAPWDGANWTYEQVQKEYLRVWEIKDLKMWEFFKSSKPQ